ncbi:MAG: DUF433 domain-containing protein [bacterium]|nr:DUF433 domain-containing protein [bacterium]
MEAKPLGRYITMDPAICQGVPTFYGTRILVADVLEQIASGMAWEAIIEEWRGALNNEAIAEAIRLGREALVAYAPELAAETPGRGTLSMRTSLTVNDRLHVWSPEPLVQ